MLNSTLILFICILLFFPSLSLSLSIYLSLSLSLYLSLMNKILIIHYSLLFNISILRRPLSFSNKTKSVGLFTQIQFLYSKKTKSMEPLKTLHTYIRKIFRTGQLFTLIQFVQCGLKTANSFLKFVKMFLMNNYNIQLIVYNLLGLSDIL